MEEDNGSISGSEYPPSRLIIPVKPNKSERIDEGKRNKKYFIFGSYLNYFFLQNIIHNR